MSTSKTWPGGATNAAPAAYSIPAAGELNWANLSAFLNALGDSAQSTTLQKFAIRKATTSPVTVSASSDCVIATDLAVPGAVTVNLPVGANKQVIIVIDDKGDAGTNNITIVPNGAETIKGDPNLIISTDRSAVALIYNSGDTDWKVIGIFGEAVPVLNPSIVVITNGSGLLSSSTVTTTTLSYLDATSSIQTQLNALSTPTIVAVSSDITLMNNVRYYVDTSAARSLTLPAPTAGATIVVKDATGSCAINNITIVRFATEKIETVAASYILNTSLASWTISSNGTDWFII